MIVLPYDPTAESETEDFMKTIVAGEGADAALATQFMSLIHDSKGQVFHGRLEGSDEPTYYAGRPVQIDGSPGYVLVAK